MKLETLKAISFDIIHICDDSTNEQRKDLALGLIDLALRNGLITLEMHTAAVKYCMDDYARMLPRALYRQKTEEDIRRELGFPFQEPYVRE